MANEIKLDIAAPKPMAPLDLNDVEMVFGTPSAPKSDTNANTHLIENEIKTTTITGHNGDNNKNGGEAESDAPDSHPLLDPGKLPPLAEAGTDDPDHAIPFADSPTGEDHDGLRIFGHLPDIHEEDNDDPTKAADGGSEGTHELGAADEMNGLSSRFGEVLSPTAAAAQAIDMNTYQQKKNLAQGMMDLALLSANANQLRYVLESKTHGYYYFSLICISLSIIFQVAVGVGLTMNSTYNLKNDMEKCMANRNNNLVVLGVFFITVINVFITAFSVDATGRATAT